MIAIAVSLLALLSSANAAEIFQATKGKCIRYAIATNNNSSSSISQQFYFQIHLRDFKVSNNNKLKKL